MVEITSYCHREHPLVLVEGQQQNINEENEKVACSNCPACGDVVLSGASRFSCGHCSNVHFHEECARAPSFLFDHPFHPQHPYVLELVTQEWRISGLACALCKEKRKNMFFYKCIGCNFSLDIKCFLTLYKFKDIIVSGCGREFKDEGHQHPFIFLENHKDELKRAFCSWCHEPLKHSIYVSLSGIGCQVTLHKKCFDNLPTQIDHPCHRLHTLFLRFSKTELFCEVCQKKDDDNFFYHCSACKFDIHIDCIWPTPTIEPSKYPHEHPLNLIFKNDSFICNACGTNGNFVSYVCHTCHIQVHKNCTSLPPKIKVSRHDHVLLHKYYFLRKGGGRRGCQICFEQVKAEYGSYLCSKEDCCNYVVHVKCALEDDWLYTIIDEENQDDDDATNDSSITPIKWNECGEAIEVRHFNHDHNLVLQDKLESAAAEDDRACDGCMLPISLSTLFYYCSDMSCNFFLHKTCAELPKIKHHWFSGFPATLNAYVYRTCTLCGRFCSGLFYYCYDYSMFMIVDMCLRCAAVPYMIKHEGHKHLLFYDHKCKGRCNGCGREHRHGAFRCKECSFTLDFHCMTYPLAVRHKCDDHLLKLTYHDDNDDDEHVGMKPNNL